MDVRTLNVGDTVAVFKPLRRGNIQNFGACRVTKKNKVRIVLTRDADGYEFVFSARHGDRISKWGRDYETSVMPVKVAERYEEKQTKSAMKALHFRNLEIAAARGSLAECKDLIAKIEELDRQDAEVKAEQIVESIFGDL